MPVEYPVLNIFEYTNAYKCIRQYGMFNEIVISIYLKPSANIILFEKRSRKG